MYELQVLLQEFAPALVLGFPFVAAALLGLLIPMLVIGASVVTARMSESMRLSVILVAMIAGSTLTVALSGRVMHSEADYELNPWLKYQDTPLPWGSRASQLCTAIVLIMAAAELLRWATSQAKMNERVRGLWLAAMSYFVISVVASGLFGEFRNPRINDLYGPLTLTALALLANGADQAMWGRVRLALLLPSAGSLLAMAALPKLALLPDYVSIFPGLHVRLFGLADHANSLGIVAAAALMIELCPLVRKRPSVIFLLCHLAVLLLAQSKTAWIAAILCAVFVRWSWIKKRVAPGDDWRAIMLLSISGLVFAAALVLVIGLGASSTRLIRAVSAAGIDGTFTGRTEIWRVTLGEFIKSPLIGYGPSLWDLQFRHERGMLAAGQAHNQFVHILGQAGALGFLTLLTYIVTMVRISLKGWQATHGLSFVLLLLVLVRCFSESPLRMGGVMGWDNWLHFVTFAAVAATAMQIARPDEVKRPAPTWVKRTIP